jgi:hypothetical protein
MEGSNMRGFIVFGLLMSAVVANSLLAQTSTHPPAAVPTPAPILAPVLPVSAGVTITLTTEQVASIVAQSGSLTVTEKTTLGEILGMVAKNKAKAAPTPVPTPSTPSPAPKKASGSTPPPTRSSDELSVAIMFSNGTATKHR